MVDVNLGYPKDVSVLIIIPLTASTYPTIPVVSGFLLEEFRLSKLFLKERLL
jgi:hypothetical protein